jgi:hypothetical protein
LEDDYGDILEVIDDVINNFQWNDGYEYSGYSINMNTDTSFQSGAIEEMIGKALAAGFISAIVGTIILIRLFISKRKKTTNNKNFNKKKFCKYCGNKINIDNGICNNCNNTTQSSQSFEDNILKPTKLWHKMLLIAVSILFLALLAFLLIPLFFE